MEKELTTHDHEITKEILDNLTKHAAETLNTTIHDALVFLTADDPDNPGTEFLMAAFRARNPLNKPENLESFINFITTCLNKGTSVAFTHLAKMVKDTCSDQSPKDIYIAVICSLIADMVVGHVNMHMPGFVEEVAKSQNVSYEQAQGLAVGGLLTRVIAYVLKVSKVQEPMFSKFIGAAQGPVPVENTNGGRKVVLFRPDGRKVDH